MKKIFISGMLALTMLFSACDKKNDIEKLSDNEIYLFYQTTCPHCHDAAKYIKQTYPQLKLNSLNIKLPGNMRLFEQAVKRYNIKGQAGTPFFAFGENYLMGWSEDERKMFDVYVKPYLNK